MRTRAAALIFLIMLAAPAARGGDRVIARVGSEAITLRELSAAVESTPGITRQEALELLIERRLVLAWARERGITAADEEVERMETSIMERNNLTEENFRKALEATGETVESFRAGLREQIIINKALGRALAVQMTVDDRDLEELYKEAYPVKTVYQVSHILFTLDKGAAAEREERIRQRAEEVLDEIREGASFETMALEYSQDPLSAGEGGLLGSFSEGELLPELEEAAADLDPGEVGGPVRTEAGYHIIKLLSKDQSEPPPLAEVRAELERTLMAEKETSARTRWLDELKETTYIEVFSDEG